MPKKAVYLVKVLGAKSYEQVLDWLRLVGHDVGAEGFSPMTEIDDETIAKLKELASGKERARGPAKRIVRPVATGEAEAPVAPRLKEFFAAAPPAPAPTAVEEKAPPVAAQPLAVPGLKQIIEERPPAKKVKLAKVKKVEEKPPEEEEEVAALDDAEVAAEVEIEERVERKKAEEEAVLRPRAKLRRPSRLSREAAVEDDGAVASRKRVFKVKGAARHRQVQEVERHLKITHPLTIREVSEKTGVRVANIIRFLMDELDILANINYVASVDEISLVCDKFGIDCEVAPADEPEQELETFAQVDREALVPRPPVITVMGHVDHGKTKLLDAIRTTNVVDTEAGGITQHIGAYQTKVRDRVITFIDTPGHEAFTAMRARGSQVTDIVVLVVAADDGVMPQTIEAVEHCQAAKVPVIVAVNKVDKADANPDRVRQQLSQRGLVPEEWGGDVVFVNVSALTKQGLDALLEMIILQADLMELKADPNAPPMGVVVENQIDTGVGIVATILVKQGTFRKGQYILCGESIGRIKRMVDENGRELDAVGPSAPARIIGFEQLPENGEKVYGFKDKKRAQQIAESRMAQRDRYAPGTPALRLSLDDVFAQAAVGAAKELVVVVKADVQGSMEAVTEALSKIDVEGVKVNVVRSGIGQINETDIMLASASGATVIGFNVTVAGQVRRIAEREGVHIRLYRVIYKLLEDMELAARGLLEPEVVETVVGELEVRAIFRTDRNSVVCGGMVTSGKALRHANYRLRRGGEVVLEGQLSSLKRFKDDVREVAEGFECGLRLEGTSDVREGDILEFYVLEKREPAGVSSAGVEPAPEEEH